MRGGYRLGSVPGGSMKPLLGGGAVRATWPEGRDRHQPRRIAPMQSEATALPLPYPIEVSLFMRSRASSRQFLRASSS
jgi:hypothetical protein